MIRESGLTIIVLELELELSTESAEITDLGRLFQMFTTQIVNEYFRES